MKNKSYSPNVFGASCLIVIFSLLCLVVFCALTLGTSLAEKRLSDIASQKASAYHAADCLAHETLAKIRADDIGQSVEKNGDLYTYSQSIDSSSSLAVTVQVQSPSSWKIIKWQSVIVDTWQNDDTINLFNP